MDNINPRSILGEAFSKLNKIQVIEYLKSKKVGWVFDKKSKRKLDLESEFLELESILDKKEIVQLAEMTVMKKTKGLPSYTYSYKNLGKLKEKDLNQLKADFEKSFPVNSVYEIVVMEIKISEEKLIFAIKVKEYKTAWKNAIQDLGSLTGVYETQVIIDKALEKISIEVGDEKIEGVIETFLMQRLGLPLVPYTIGIFNEAYSQSDSATQKTMLIFDFVYNRLPSKGISSKFNDVKFKISNVTMSGGVRGVTIHGQDIINSDEACKYITLGNDIVTFKTTSIYKGEKLNVKFDLRGKNFDKLKIVIMDDKTDGFKREVMEQIQAEYILMCKNGIKDFVSTKKKLEPIYLKFINAQSA
ncbi:hypothetical protein EXW50_28050 (plasmid) [Bacillus mycoides]|uniref:hypothetical protein n=1 Tax=Bacillus mycoides TaxID=1405 RepID=UPI001C036D13|nr:hypothetical protein [Bacillus mycoides]QWG75810.1 hypothetical protein EXW63_27630 [Bacillus mycoides]QWH26193.1 hypothetical protein EXW50_28050 [Bacillus mycoides]